MKALLIPGRRKGSLAVLVALVGLGHPPLVAASECAESGYISSVCWTAASYCPERYLPANGQLLRVTDHEALFSLIVNRFGGDGINNFALPDLRGRAIAGANQDPSLPLVLLGARYGREYASLDVSNMAAHTHKWLFASAKLTGTLYGADTLGDSTSPQNRFPANRPPSGPGASSVATYAKSANASLKSNVITLAGNTATNRTDPAGSTEPRPIPLRPAQQPLLACIAIEGVYPVRPN
jgi:microcystin-dependent protein